MMARAAGVDCRTFASILGSAIAYVHNHAVLSFMYHAVLDVMSQKSQTASQQLLEHMLLTCCASGDSASCLRRWSMNACRAAGSIPPPAPFIMPDTMPATSARLTLRVLAGAAGAVPLRAV
jgi:hypothetical protein